MTFTRFIERPVLSTVISVFLVLLGLIGLVSLPIEQYPDIAPPTISVSTIYQGADAQTVLNSVITPLEESINGVENMRKEKGNDKQKSNVCEMSLVSYPLKKGQKVENECFGT